MGREIRRVPPDWEHPCDVNGCYYPLYDNTYLGKIISHLAFCLRWCYLYGIFEDWPSSKYARQPWRKRKATHFQIYKTVGMIIGEKGMPASPVFATREELADWLVGQGHSRRASNEFAERGWAPDMVLIDGCAYYGIDMYDSLLICLKLDEE